MTACFDSSLNKNNMKEFSSSMCSSAPKTEMSDSVQEPKLRINMLISMKLNQTRMRTFLSQKALKSYWEVSCFSYCLVLKGEGERGGNYGGLFLMKRIKVVPPPARLNTEHKWVTEAITSATPFSFQPQDQPLVGKSFPGTAQVFLRTLHFSVPDVQDILWVISITMSEVYLFYWYHSSSWWWEYYPAVGGV